MFEDEKKRVAQQKLWEPYRGFWLCVSDIGKAGMWKKKPKSEGSNSSLTSGEIHLPDSAATSVAAEPPSPKKASSPKKPNGAATPMLALENISVAQILRECGINDTDLSGLAQLSEADLESAVQNNKIVSSAKGDVSLGECLGRHLFKALHGSKIQGMGALGSTSGPATAGSTSTEAQAEDPPPIPNDDSSKSLGHKHRRERSAIPERVTDSLEDSGGDGDNGEDGSEIGSVEVDLGARRKAREANETGPKKAAPIIATAPPPLDDTASNKRDPTAGTTMARGQAKTSAISAKDISEAALKAGVAAVGEGGVVFLPDEGVHVLHCSG